MATSTGYRRQDPRYENLARRGGHQHDLLRKESAATADSGHLISNTNPLGLQRHTRIAQEIINRTAARDGALQSLQALVWLIGFDSHLKRKVLKMGGDIRITHQPPQVNASFGIEGQLAEFELQLFRNQRNHHAFAAIQ